LLSFDDIENNIYIKVPVSLETYFVQGSYQKILTQQQNVPMVAYNFFIEKFVDAIRYEIARSAEVSYDSLSLKDMLHMFMITDMNQL
jgi:26S proteasome regulatory subunit N12